MPQSNRILVHSDSLCQELPYPPNVWKRPLRSPLSVFESYLPPSDSRYLSLSLLIPSAWIMPCEWALHTPATCYNLLISLPWALSPIWHSSALQNTPDTPDELDVCAPPEYLGNQLSPQTPPAYQEAGAGRGCMPRGLKGRGGRCPRASSRASWASWADCDTEEMEGWSAV